MKNIGIVTTWYERGAAYVSKQYASILDSSANVFIYHRGGEKNATIWQNENVTIAEKIPLAIPMAMDKKHFRNWIITNNIKYIIFNEQQWWQPVLWAKELNVITIAYIDYYTETTIPFFGIYDLLLCNTKRHYSVFSWHHNVVYIPWGTDIELFGDTKKVRHTLVTPNFVTFFHSSGVSPERKGTDTLIEAFYNSCGKGRLIIHTQVNLLEKLPDRYKQLIETMLKQDRIEIIQETVTAPGLYHRGDVYVYPSRLEGIGLTVAEAMASGLAVIVPDNPPMNEFITSETGKTVEIEQFFSREDGYYWPQCKVSSDDLTKQIQFFIDNPDKTIRYKKNSYLHAKEKLNWKNNASELYGIIKNTDYIPVNEKLKKEIIQYDINKNKYNITAIVYYKFPIIFKIIKSLYVQFK